MGNPKIDATLPSLKVCSFRPFSRTCLKWNFVAPEVMVQEGGWSTLHPGAAQ